MSDFEPKIPKQESSEPSKANFLLDTDQELAASERLATIHRELQKQIPRGTTQQTYVQLTSRDNEPPQAMVETTFPDWNFTVPLDDGREAKLVLLQFCPPRNKLGALILGKGPQKKGKGTTILAAKTTEDTAVPLYEFSDTDSTICDSVGVSITQEDTTALRRLVESADDSMISCINTELEIAKTEHSSRAIQSRLKLLHELTPHDDTPLREHYLTARTRLHAARHLLEAAAGLSDATEIQRFGVKPAWGSDDWDNIKEVCDRFMQLPYGTLDLSEELSKIMGYIPYDNHPSSGGGKVLEKLIRVVELTKELKDARSDLVRPHVAFMQQPTIRQKITAALAEH